MLELFYSDTVSVETFEGAGDFGDEYAAPADVEGFFDDGLIRVSSPTGDVVESVSTFFCDVGEAWRFTPESRVTVAGRSAVMQVESAKVRQASPLFGEVRHVEVRLR